MGLLRWLLWPRRSKKDEEPEKVRRRRDARHTRDHPGVYRIEVDREAGHLRSDGPPFSFWSSSRIILILAFLLWWIQPAGPMIAGYVGGRRAGSPWKAVLAALLPVIVILVANVSYAHSLASRQIDFVASLPIAVGDGAASILPFLAPYKDFMIGYIQGFVNALQATFGMGTNGYLMVILFAYIGGLIGEQTRRELQYRSGSSTSFGLNLVQPFLRGRARDEEEYEDEEEEEAPRPHRRPTRAALHPPLTRPQRRRSRRGHPDRLEEYRQVPAEVLDSRDRRNATRNRRIHDDEEDEEEPDRSRHPAKSRASSRRAPEHEEPEEEPSRRGTREKRPSRPRSHEEEMAIQRFVERALRQYDHAKL